MKEIKCSGCAKAMDTQIEGVELWGLWFCAMCFIGRAQSLHREIKPEDIELLKVIGRELSGFLPAELLEMILVGFWRRTTGRTDEPPREEVLRVAGELQRLTVFANFGQVLRLLKTWQGMFNEFVEGQELDIREKIKKLTEGE